MYRDEPLSSLVYTAFNGKVFALERDTGREVWRYDLGRGHAPVQIHVEAGVVIAAASDTVAILEPGTGSVIARTDIPGLGRAQERVLLLVDAHAIFVSHGGELTCLDRAGEVRWTNAFAGTGYGDPSIAVQGRAVHGVAIRKV